MILYPLFYRRNGVRRVGQMMTPPKTPLKDLELPRECIFHYAGESTSELGPPSDYPLFRHVVRPIYVYHVRDIGDRKGNPRKAAVQIDSMIRHYHTQNRRYRNAKFKDQVLKDALVPGVFNYALLPRLYHYMRSLYSNYNRWWNDASAVWKNIGELTGHSERQQFVVVRLPQLLPGISTLKIAAEDFQEPAMAAHDASFFKNNVALETMDDAQAEMSIALEAMTQRSLKVFNTPEACFLLEMWKWCGEQRAESLISHVPVDQLRKINLICIESGSWFVVNLGVINDWRIATKEELEANPNLNQKGLPADQFQRRFLRMMMSLMQNRSAAAPQVTEVVNQSDAEIIAARNSGASVPEETIDQTLAGKVIQAASDQPEPVADATGLQTTTFKQEIITPKLDPKTGAVVLVSKEVKVPEADLVDSANATIPSDTGSDIEIDHQLDAEITRDLAALDEIINTAPIEEEDLLATIMKPSADPGLEAGINDQINRLAESGQISAGEFRRYQQLSTRYKTLPAPNGKENLGSFIQIPKEDTEIKASQPVATDIKNVVDKTMLKSTLLQFDEQYITKVMEKNVAQMVLNIQKSGLCVTDYQVEQVDDIMGSYKVYTVRVTPVNGANSTLRFKLPVLSPDGSFVANGVTYRMRKQRGDRPIRKTGPDRVTLTSYYGKLFIMRSGKAVNDFGAWLRNQIMVMGLDESNDMITDLHPGNVFDNLYQAPRLYSALAQGFRSFKVLGRYEFSFDASQRFAEYGEELVKKVEADGNVIVGRETNGNLLVMDRDDALYVFEDGKLKELPAFTELIQLSTINGPVDFVEIKVLGRAIPLALVLGYEMGLETLMKTLRVQPRRVLAGQRLNLSEHEFAIQFADESLIFSRDNRMAALIFAGFRAYAKELRRWPVHEFDKRGVYLNLLESGGASARYIREIDLMYQMFIDPICRTLLEQMHEPTDFRGLLLRATQMLLTDHHPDELDNNYMRLKGNERMAGAVYSELVRAIRVHNGRSGKQRHPIDLNPYAVWKNINQDPSIMLVKNINPVENLKQQEAVTFSGTGGRSGRSMTKRTRVYHPSDMGTISESTVDSGDVAINTFTSADPQLTSIWGLSKPYDMEEKDPTALLSTSALLSPGSDRDD